MDGSLDYLDLEFAIQIEMKMLFLNDSLAVIVFLTFVWAFHV